MLEWVSQSRLAKKREKSVGTTGSAGRSVDGALRWFRICSRHVFHAELFLRVYLDLDERLFSITGFGVYPSSRTS